MNDITIVVIDTVTHELSKKSIEKTIQNIDCKEIMIFSDKNFYSDGIWIKIFPIDKIGYSEFLIKNLYEHIKTDHVLVIQNDGMAVNKEKWSSEFLNFDYIGAVWPPNVGPQTFGGVGNGGFSLRSKKLLKELKNDIIVFNPKKNINSKNDFSAEDFLICVYYRNWLEEKDIKFGSVEIANQFSHEFEPDFKDTFGFHGIFNIPHYLTDEEIHDFILLLPKKLNNVYVAMILELIRVNKINLARLAIDLGRKNNVWGVYFPNSLSHKDVLSRCVDFTGPKMVNHMINYINNYNEYMNDL